MNLLVSLFDMMLPKHPHVHSMLSFLHPHDHCSQPMTMFFPVLPVFKPEALCHQDKAPMMPNTSSCEKPKFLQKLGLFGGTGDGHGSHIIFL